MIVTVLGCGTSSGVPLIGCACPVCVSSNPKNHRTRASVWIQAQSPEGAPISILIDASADFRAQALREKIPRIDAVLFTHPHSDHISGIDDLRAYNFIQKTSIPVYGHRWTRDELFLRYSYIFKPAPVEGGGIPQLDFQEINAANYFDFKGLRVQPLSVAHGSKETLGYRLGSFAYVTDCHSIPEETRARMRGLKVLVLDCVRIDPHATHFHFDAAMEAIQDLKPERAYLTHLGHDFEYAEWSAKLPKGTELAYDGLRIQPIPL